MPVAEGVDHQDVNRASHTSEVSPRGREHVPRIHIHETSKEVNAVSGNQSNQDDTGPRRAEEGLEEMANTLVEREIKCTASEGVLDQVEGQDYNIRLEDAEVDKRERVGQA